jgi:hypothetical protein
MYSMSFIFIPQKGIGQRKDRNTTRVSKNKEMAVDFSSIRESHRDYGDNPCINKKRVWLIVLAWK